MAHIGLTELEMHGHYIELEGPNSEREVLAVLHRLIRPRNVARTDRCPPLLTLSDGRTIMFVDVDPGPGCPVVLSIGNLDDDDLVLARTVQVIQQALLSGTSWRLRRCSDTRRNATVTTPAR